MDGQVPAVAHDVGALLHQRFALRDGGAVGPRRFVGLPPLIEEAGQVTADGGLQFLVLGDGREIRLKCLGQRRPQAQVGLGLLGPAEQGQQAGLLDQVVGQLDARPGLAGGVGRDRRGLRHGPAELGLRVAELADPLEEAREVIVAAADRLPVLDGRGLAGDRLAEGQGPAVGRLGVGEPAAGHIDDGEDRARRR